MSDAVIGSGPTIEPVPDTFNEVARTLQQARIRWALLRMPDGGLSAPTGDIDLLVHPADAVAAVGVLDRLAFTLVPRAGRDIHLLRYIESIDRWVWLHVTTKLSFGTHDPRARGEEGWCLASRRYEGGMPRLDLDVEFWTLLWHCLADKGRVALHHRGPLRDASVAARCDSTAAHAFAAACGDAAMNARLLDAVIHDDWGAVESCAHACGHRPTRVLAPTRITALITRCVDALRHWRVRRGLSVAVLGPDGAGKSTLVAGIAASVPFPSRTIYMGLTGGALRHVRRLRVPGVVFLASACVIWSRYLCACAHMARGRLVLFDRYVYDAVAPPGYTPGPFERLGRRLSGHLCPSPDLVILLNAPGTVMHARKKSYDSTRLEMWRQGFLTLAARLDALEVVDAAQAAATVRRDAVARIWRRYLEHWDVRRRLRRGTQP